MDATATLDELLATPEPAHLGPLPRPGTLPADTASRLARNLARTLQLPPARADTLEALLLLWHDHHEPAHALVQDLPDADAAFVHGILHRREPDDGNARYWFHRLGNHPAMIPLAQAAAPLLDPHPHLHRLLPNGRWDPMAMIAAASAARQPGLPPYQIDLLRQLQALETRTLAQHLIRG